MNFTAAYDLNFWLIVNSSSSSSNNPAVYILTSEINDIHIIYEKSMKILKFPRLRQQKKCRLSKKKKIYLNKIFVKAHWSMLMIVSYWWRHDRSMSTRCLLYEFKFFSSLTFSWILYEKNHNAEFVPLTLCSAADAVHKCLQHWDNGKCFFVCVCVCVVLIFPKGKIAFKLPFALHLQSIYIHFYFCHVQFMCLEGITLKVTLLKS